MNIRLDTEGNVYTSESGPGTIKKFSKDGKLIDYIAKAKIVPGCKRVCLDMNKDLTRFYMLDITRSRIIVFEDLNRITTHEQTDTISIPQDGEKLPIHSFCVDKKGRLLATCGGSRVSVRRKRLEDGSYETVVTEKDDPGMIKVLDADGKLLDTWKLDFMPRAINVAPDGTIYAAGDGQIAKLDENGKVLKTVDAPNVAELGPIPEMPEVKEEKLTDEEKAVKKEKLKNLRAKQREVSKKLRENYKLRIEAKDEDEKVKLAEELEKLNKKYAQLRDQYKSLTYSAREVAARKYQAAMRKRYIPGIAISDKNIFVAGYPAKGHGFAVWRMDLDFSNPKLIVEKLRGCCRQLDIQCKDGKLWVAENSRKRVTCYDPEGKQLVQFGTNERKDKNSGYGFGSCCNPMNIRFNAAGDVYTAEASVGRLKRFSADGKFIETVAKLKIVPGCKHVAIGVSNDGDRIYMLDITRSQIAVVDRKKEK
jgi:sugar lactone lactonase YvrE